MPRSHPLTPLQVQAGGRALENVKFPWRSWIDTHQAELQQMKPTSEGISFDPNSYSGIADISALQRRLKAVGAPEASGVARLTYDSDVAFETNKYVRRAFS